MLHDPKRPRRRGASATVPPRFTIQAESFLSLVDELPPLFARYGAESGVFPVDPNWQHLMQMALNGVLHMVTARYDGTLVGFCLNIVNPTPMYRTKVYGNTFAVWIDKPYRTGMNGVRLLRWNKRYLTELGCVRLLIATSDPRLGKVYERLGYRAHETHYASDGHG